METSIVAVDTCQIFDEKTVFVNSKEFINTPEKIPYRELDELILHDRKGNITSFLTIGKDGPYIAYAKAPMKECVEEKYQGLRVRIEPIIEYSFEYPYGRPAIIWLKSKEAFYKINSVALEYQRFWNPVMEAATISGHVINALLNFRGRPLSGRVLSAIMQLSKQQPEALFSLIRGHRQFILKEILAQNNDDLLQFNLSKRLKTAKGLSPHLREALKSKSFAKNEGVLNLVNVLRSDDEESDADVGTDSVDDNLHDDDDSKDASISVSSNANADTEAGANSDAYNDDDNDEDSAYEDGYIKDAMYVCSSPDKRLIENNKVNEKRLRPERKKAVPISDQKILLTIRCPKQKNRLCLNTSDDDLLEKYASSPEPSIPTKTILATISQKDVAAGMSKKLSKQSEERNFGKRSLTTVTASLAVIASIKLPSQDDNKFDCPFCGLTIYQRENLNMVVQLAKHIDSFHQADHNSANKDRNEEFSSCIIANGSFQDDDCLKMPWPSKKIMSHYDSFANYTPKPISNQLAQTVPTTWPFNNFKSVPAKEKQTKIILSPKMHEPIFTNSKVPQKCPDDMELLESTLQVKALEGENAECKTTSTTICQSTTPDNTAILPQSEASIEKCSVPFLVSDAVNSNNDHNLANLAQENCNTCCNSLSKADIPFKKLIPRPLSSLKRQKDAFLRFSKIISATPASPPCQINSPSTVLNALDDNLSALDAPKAIDALASVSLVEQEKVNVKEAEPVVLIEQKEMYGKLKRPAVFVNVNNSNSEKAEPITVKKQIRRIEKARLLENVPVRASHFDTFKQPDTFKQSGTFKQSDTFKHSDIMPNQSKSMDCHDGLREDKGIDTDESSTLKESQPLKEKTVRELKACSNIPPNNAFTDMQKKQFFHINGLLIDTPVEAQQRQPLVFEQWHLTSPIPFSPKIKFSLDSADKQSPCKDSEKSRDDTSLTGPFLNNVIKAPTSNELAFKLRDVSTKTLFQFPSPPSTMSTTLLTTVPDPLKDCSSRNHVKTQPLVQSQQPHEDGSIKSSSSLTLESQNNDSFGESTIFNTQIIIDRCTSKVNDKQPD